MNFLNLVWGWFQGRRPGTDDHIDGRLSVQAGIEGELTVTPGLLGQVSLRESSPGEVVLNP